MRKEKPYIIQIYPSFKPNEYKLFARIWNQWRRDEDISVNCKDPALWGKKFKCRVITTDCEQRWTHLEFPSKGAYMLFLLENK